MRERKIARYLAAGSRVAFDVNPSMRVLHVHAADGMLTLSSDERCADANVAWLQFPVAEIVSDLDD